MPGTAQPVGGTIAAARARPRARRLGGAAALMLLAAACSSTHTAGTTKHPTTTSPPVTGPSTTRSPITRVGSTSAFRLVASDGRAGDSFGGALWYDTFKTPIPRVYLGIPGETAISADGSVAVVGAPGASGRAHRTPGSGDAYVFARAGENWSEVAALTASDGAAHDAFGSAVAISGDGHDVVIGAPYTDHGDAIDAGSVYVFHAVNGTWHQSAEFTAPDHAAYGNLGWSVAISRDGLTAVAGAPSHAAGAVHNAGAAFVFTRPSAYGHWTERNLLHASAPRSGANFGAAVALSGDGFVAVVTEMSRVDAQHRLESGAVYVLSTQDRWTRWSRLAGFTDPHRNAGARSDSFGVAVTVSDDARVVAVAAPAATVGGRVSVGAVDIYAVSNGWAGRARPVSHLTLVPRHPAAYLYYGSAIALSASGRRLVVGIDGAGTDNQGAVELVELPALGDPTPLRTVGARHAVASPSSTKGRFGAAVAVSSDGATGLVERAMAGGGCGRRAGRGVPLRLEARPRDMIGPKTPRRRQRRDPRRLSDRDTWRRPGEPHFPPAPHHLQWSSARPAHLPADIARGMNERPGISVVVCCYTDQRWDDLCAAIDSVRAQTSASDELIVAVDHAPALAERLRARGEVDGVTIVESDGPRGLSGARNTGIAAARGDIVAFLDDDAVAAPDWLDELCLPYRNPGVAGVGGRVVPRWDGPRPAWFPPEFEWVVGCTYEGHPGEGPVRNVIGANMSFRRAVFDRVGGFDDKVGRIAAHPSGCEETELCIRVGQKIPGSIVWYAPSAVVHHRVGGERATFAYFRARCLAEGGSKQRVARLVGSRDGLASERTYTTRTLPRAAAPRPRPRPAYTGSRRDRTRRNTGRGRCARRHRSGNHVGTRAPHVDAIDAYGAYGRRGARFSTRARRPGGRRFAGGDPRRRRGRRESVRAGNPARTRARTPARRDRGADGARRRRRARR